MAEAYNRKEEQDPELLNWEDALYLFSSRWHWFALSVVAALCIAVFYLFKTAPVYTRTTQVLIKDENKNGGNGTIQTFSDLGIIANASNISNEILTISTPVMMHEVVRRLGLDLQLSTKERLHQHPLYKNAPVKVEPLDKVHEDHSFGFDLTLKGGNEVELSNFRDGNGDTDDRTLKARFGQPVKTPVGTFRIQSTPYLDDYESGTVVTVNKHPLSRIADSYAARLSVALDDKESTVLRLTLSDEDPQRADDVLLTLVDVYNEQWMKDKNRIAESTFQFISDRLDTISKELGIVDSKISEYKSRNLLPDVAAASNMYMAQSGKNQDNLLELENQLSMVRYIRNYLRDKNKQDQLLPANTGFTNNSIESLIQNYNETLLRRDELLHNSSMQNSLVAELTEKLAAQRSVITRSVDNFIAQLEKQAENVKRSEAGTNQQIASNPRHARLMLSAERQQKVKEELYIFLLQKREENELSKAYTAYNTRIIQPPMGSSLPTSPKRNTVLMMAFAIGLALPAAVLLVKEMLNHTVRSRRDLEKYDIPFIGEIPLYASEPKRWWQRDAAPGKRTMVVTRNGKDLINESFRLLRTKLDYYLNGKNNAKVIMLTSFNPGSGKTFITANMAKILALKGGRTLAIDMDLRRTSLSRMGQSVPNGLSSYLNGEEDDLPSLIVKDGLGEDTDLLPVGIIPPNPTEVLLSDRMKSLFDYAKEHYDYVLVDCPPIELVADAAIIRQYVDASLFIIRVGLMDRRLLKDVENLYREKKYENMALVLNGGYVVKGKYGNYRYGYGYGYGYGYDEKK